MIGSIAGLRGRLEFDATKPDRAPHKLLDVTRPRALGWQPRAPLRIWIEQTRAWFKDHVVEPRRSIEA